MTKAEQVERLRTKISELEGKYITGDDEFTAELRRLQSGSFLRREIGLGAKVMAFDISGKDRYKLDRMYSNIDATHSPGDAIRHGDYYVARVTECTTYKVLVRI